MSRWAHAAVLATAGAIGVVVLGGCGNIAIPDIKSSKDINVPGRGVGIGNALLPEQAFPADLIGQALAQSISQGINTSGYDKTHVASLKLTQLTLTVQDPNDAQGTQVKDLSFLQSLAVFLEKQGDDSTKIKVAQSGDGDFAKKPIKYDVPLTNAELAPLFKSADNLTMTSDVTPGQPPNFQTTVTVASTVHVEVSVF
jgi:hypothetical protein